MVTLTPADVHNVAFSRPPIGKRGYNEEEVDQFLDLVEAELNRLIEEKDDLEQRVAELSNELEEAQVEVERAQAAAAPAAAPAPESKPVSAPAENDTNLKAAHILGLAQEMADRLTSEARQEADEMLSSARSEADRLVTEATETSNRRMAETERNIKAMEEEAVQKHTTLMETINQQRSVLEGRIDQLRTFERQYRSRLQELLESQLEDLRGSNVGESFA